MLPSPTISKRIPVWTALSELFLDTELSDEDINHIALVLGNSGYGRDELDEILRDEVSPAFTFNLCSVAGEWTPWSEDEVRTIVEGWLAKRGGGWLTWVRLRFQPRIIPQEWQRILPLLR